MNKTRARRFSFLFQLGGIVFAFLFISVILLLVDENPIDTFRLIWEGAVGSSSRISNVLVVWVPIVLVTCGLLVTFTTGLWNIGIEGQITLGAILTVPRHFCLTCFGDRSFNHRRDGRGRNLGCPCWRPKNIWGGE